MTASEPALNCLNQDLAPKWFFSSLLLPTLIIMEYCQTRPRFYALMYSRMLQELYKKNQGPDFLYAFWEDVQPSNKIPPKSSARCAVIYCLRFKSHSASVRQFPRSDALRHRWSRVNICIARGLPNSCVYFKGDLI